MDDNKKMPGADELHDNDIEAVNGGGVKEMWENVTEFVENTAEKVSEAVEGAADVFRFIDEVKK